MISLILLIVLMILLTAFFSGAEIAFFSANRLKIELKNIQGNYNARLLSDFIKNPGHFIATILIGNNFALVIYGILISKLLDPIITTYLGWGPDYQPIAFLGLQTLVSTLIILFLGEFVPKALFRRNPDRMIYISAPFIRLFYWIFLPFVWLLSIISQNFMRLFFGVKIEREQMVFGRTDLDLYLKESLGFDNKSYSEPIHDIDTEAFNKALDFNKIRARDIMVPRIDMVAVPVESSIESLRQLFVETGLSKIIVYEGNLDQVKGIVHSIELFRHPKNLAEILQPVLIVPETMPANLLLTEFTLKRKSTAIVVDEFGGTSGLVTIEDLVEEIFGEIEDEHDEPEEETLLEKKEGDGVWLFSARHSVDYLNETYGLEIPEGDYTTLGGFLMHVAEEIPATGDRFDENQLEMTVVEGDAKSISVIRVKQNLNS
jgi:CBS domain containing-hemolysin-like protein